MKINRVSVLYVLRTCRSGFLHVKHIAIKRHSSTKAFRRTTLQHVLIWIFVMPSPLFSMIWMSCKYTHKKKLVVLHCTSALFLKWEVRTSPSEHDFTNHHFENCSLEHSLPATSLHLQLSTFLYKLFMVSLKGCELKTYFLFKSLPFWNSFENGYS